MPDDNATKYHAFVTISGCGEDECYDYLYSRCILEGYFDTFGEALHFYGGLYIKGFGAIAHYIHATHPDLTQIEAEYDIYQLVNGQWEPVGDTHWFINDAIWWQE